MSATTARVFDAMPWPDQDPYVRQADCPSWCRSHPLDGIPSEAERCVWLHEGEVTVGAMTVELFREIYPSPDTLGDYALLPQVDVAYGQGLLDLAAALTLARETLLAEDKPVNR